MIAFTSYQNVQLL